MQWSIRCLARGIFPDSRHDDTEFLASDAIREAKSNTGMRLKAACLYVKGDWSEYAGTLGFPTWADSLRPCFECCGFGLDLYIAFGNSMQTLRWESNHLAAYEMACRRCIVDVLIATGRLHTFVIERLVYDKNKDGGRGRCLMDDVLECGLRKGDRLEPFEGLTDIGRFEEKVPPFTARFWRRSEESLTRHLNPLFVGPFALKPSLCMTVDTLHAFYLGVMKTWAIVAVWAILESGVFGRLSDETLPSCMLAFRATLFAWYKERRASHPTENLTEMHDWLPKMIGTRASPKLSSKGAETYGLLRCLVDLLHRYKEKVADFHRIVQAGEALGRIVDIWHANDWTLPERDREEDNAKTQPMISSICSLRIRPDASYFLTHQGFCIAQGEHAMLCEAHRSDAAVRHLRTKTPYHFPPFVFDEVFGQSYQICDVGG